MLIFKKTNLFKYCEIDYYEFRVAVINFNKRFYVKLIIDYLTNEPFFTFKNKVYLTEKNLKTNEIIIPDWFNKWWNNGGYKKIHENRFTVEEKFLFNGMKNKVNEYYKKVGFIN